MHKHERKDEQRLEEAAERLALGLVEIKATNIDLRLGKVDENQGALDVLGCARDLH
ncbi:MAG: hypothetical protein GTN80_03435 [Nitrososphaeria archaeon]|nr:hypothetical protein [Nitrososphaeria archaeon]NIQ32684.1 hypothetical protein [Nitrososphaeria archaeon]